MLKGIKLPDWKYFKDTPSRKIKGKFDSAIKIRCLKESIPDWIDNLAVEELEKSYGKKKFLNKMNRLSYY